MTEETKEPPDNVVDFAKAKREAEEVAEKAARAAFDKTQVEMEIARLALLSEVEYRGGAQSSSR